MAGARASNTASTNDVAFKVLPLCCNSFTGRRTPNLDPSMSCKDHLPNMLHLDKLPDSCPVSSLFLPACRTQPAYMHAAFQGAFARTYFIAPWSPLRIFFVTRRLTRPMCIVLISDSLSWGLTLTPDASVRKTVEQSYSVPQPCNNQWVSRFVSPPSSSLYTVIALALPLQPPRLPGCPVRHAS
jgi:hypothetical protein